MKPHLISAFAVLLALMAPAAAGEYQDLVDGLRAASARNGITRVAVGAFSAADPASQEARFAAEKLLAGLSADPELQVLDQSALEAQASGKDGWLRALPSRLRPQALIKGAVFSDGGRVTVVARLVEASTGRVLLSVESKTAARFAELPPVPDIAWDGGVSLAAMPDPFRDAPSDDGFDCQAAFKRMDALNAKAADMKARYWAAKMKEPGFLTGSLTRNPGSEIRDPQVRQKFYETLGDYYENGAPVLSSSQVRQLEDFMQREGDVIDRCGLK